MITGQSSPVQPLAQRSAAPNRYVKPQECVAAWYAYFRDVHGAQARPTLGWLCMRTGLTRSTVQACRRRIERDQPPETAQ